ncbi:unnamed protein product [Caenorhabditis auriculariae]|uniref:RRM domain-containing protein n=1 Tax=Caenorhabditis auriculariae TaxID=2777116 RepID=A0A8S1GNB6_9PELO|nr:unnamed protein product [Caenorhabditis auriculariae]
MSVIIRLQNLPLTAGASDVRAFFSGLKIPDGAVHIVGGAEGDAFIGFASDEDARQAMRRDKGLIHQTEVRLYLSSRSEMASIIEHAKSAALIDKLVQPSISHIQSALSKPEPASIKNDWDDSLNTSSEQIFPPVIGNHAPYVPTPIDHDKISYGRGPSAPSSMQIPKHERMDLDNSKESYHNYSNFGGNGPKSGNAPVPSLQYFSGSTAPSRNDAAVKYDQFAEKNVSPLPVAGAVGGPKSIADILASIPMHLRPPHGIPPPHLRHFFTSPPKESVASHPMAPPSLPVETGRGHTNGKNDFLQRSEKDYEKPIEKSWTKPYEPIRKPTIPPPTRNESWRAPAHEPERSFHAERRQDERKEEHRDRRPLGDSKNFRGERVRSPPRRYSPSRALKKSSSERYNDRRVHREPSPPNYLEHKPTTRSATEEGFKYVELSRLTTEMLRPSALEQFIKPQTPLSLSSVKVVYGPQGIHMHTLVRFENRNDADALLARDGEMGIKIRKTDAKEFDSAIDGLPPAVIAQPFLEVDVSRSNRDSKEREIKDRDSKDRDVKERDNKDKDSKDRDRRESVSPRTRRARRVRRDKRSRSKSPERRSKRRRTRSPPPVKPQQDPNRWCLQVLNVPFKCKDEELMEWLSERSKPVKVTRTFYNDGNASDRWIAEFENEDEMNRAASIRTLCKGRTLRMSFIENSLADELMKIKDTYGDQQKAKWEKEHGPTPSTSTGLPKPGVPNRPPGHFTSNGPISLAGAFGHPMPASATLGLRPAIPPLFGPTNFPRNMNGPMRGGPPLGLWGRGGPMRPFGGNPQGMHWPPPPDFSRGGFRGRGRGRGAPYMANGRHPPHNSNSHEETEGINELSDPKTAELVATIGAKGVVLACHGFPSDITLEDIMTFFNGFNADGNTVRMRMGDDGIPTGECMLSVRDNESAQKAVKSLNGRSLRGKTVSLSIAN